MNLASKSWTSHGIPLTSCSQWSRRKYQLKRETTAVPSTCSHTLLRKINALFNCHFQYCSQMRYPKITGYQIIYSTLFDKKLLHLRYISKQTNVKLDHVEGVIEVNRWRFFNKIRKCVFICSNVCKNKKKREISNIYVQ